MVERGLLSFKSTPSIVATGVTVGPMERKSPFKDLFDKRYDDERCGLPSNEKAHSKMMEDAIRIALQKAGSAPGEVDFLMAGDLVNQMTPTNFCASTLQIPFLGLFSACATSVSSLLTAALLTEVGLSKISVAGASSQHNAVERQFRYPIEYGAQKPQTAQWTVTAAGAAVVTPAKDGYPVMTNGTVGRVVDPGLKNPFNMGAAMAPAAADTVIRHLKGHQCKVDDFDAIVTGDLGSTGFQIFTKLMEQQGAVQNGNFRDAGMEFYGGAEEFLSGASGAGSSAGVYFTDIYQKLMKGNYKRVLLVATGALLSPLSFQQGETIPCIAHAVELTMK